MLTHTRLIVRMTSAGDTHEDDGPAHRHMEDAPDPNGTITMLVRQYDQIAVNSARGVN